MNNNNYDVILIGAGPSSIFFALEFKKKLPSARILMIEQGSSIESRQCNVVRIGKCTHCHPFCNITCGFSGAAAFSDGKLSLYSDGEIQVGGNVSKYIGEEKTKELIDYVDSLYLEYGADNKIEGISNQDAIKRYSELAKAQRLELLSVPVRHLGTEKAHEIYLALQTKLFSLGVVIMFNSICSDIIAENGRVCGVKVENSFLKKSVTQMNFYSEYVVAAVGRKGANWLSDICHSHDITCKSGVVDIGIRYELPNEIMEDVNSSLYEAKFVGQVQPYGDKVRTFCQNPSGFVTKEVYDNDIILTNGHSYKEKKSNNTNVAILVSHHFEEPFDQPLQYGRNIAQNCNMLASESVLVQRYGDICMHHRSRNKDIINNSVIPTLRDVSAGDVTLGIGYRTMSDIMSFISKLERIIPGFADPDNLVYAPEVKFYSNEILLNSNFETSLTGLYSIGDAGGLTRGLMQASVSGVHLARVLA